MNLNLFNSIQKTFDAESIPDMFKDLIPEEEKGDWIYGIGSTSDIDRQGEKVVVTDEIARGLEKEGSGNYNKIYMEHESKNFPAGLIKFSRMVDGKHMILMKLNDAHPQAKNILGSINNRTLDSFSIKGNAPDKTPLPGGGIERTVNELHEVSLTSMPANPNAGILGTFKKSIDTTNGQFFKTSYGGVEFLDNKMEVATMPDDIITKADFDAFTESVKGSIDGLTTRVGTIETNFTAFKKAVGDEDTKEEETTVEETEEETSEEKKEETTEETKEEKKDDDVAKSINDRISNIEKSLIAKRAGEVDNTNPLTAPTIPKKEATPFMDVIDVALGRGVKK